MLQGYLNHLTWRNFIGSTGKRLGRICFRQLPEILYGSLPIWLRVPLSIATQSSGEMIGKEVTLWAITPNANQISHDANTSSSTYIEDTGFVIVDPTPDEIKRHFPHLNPDEDFVILSATLNVEPPPDNVAAAISESRSYLLSCIQEIRDTAMHRVMTITGADIAEKTGGAISSALTTTLFVLIMGPPSLCALPIVLVLEGGIKSIGAYVSREVFKKYQEQIELEMLTDLSRSLKLFQINDTEIQSGDELSAEIQITPFKDAWTATPPKIEPYKIIECYPEEGGPNLKN